jgi:hypothetical protein
MDKIKIGDLVKLSGLAEHHYGVEYGTVVDHPIIGGPAHDDLWATVMMYKGGIGQFTQKIHVSRLEVVFPVGKL